MAFARNTAAGPAKGTLAYFEHQSRSGRIFWILTLFLSVINVVMAVTGDTSDEGFTVYLLSAYLPLDFIVGANSLVSDFGHSVITTILYAVPAAFLLVGILSAIFWKKHPAWSLIATILYAIDCVYFFYINGFSDIKLTLGHVAVMVLVAVGFYFALKAHKARKTAEQNLDAATQQTAEQAAANTGKGPEL